jgi:cytoskeletal protein RodZ
VVDLNPTNGEPPVSPSSFGEQLRRIREGAGVRIEDIVAETKVSKTILEALEEGRFRRLPERVFSRSFVAQYARTVGVEEGPILATFDRAWEQYRASSGVHSNLTVIDDDLGPPIHWRFWIPMLAGGLILIVAGLVILLGSSSIGDELMPDPRRSGARLPSTPGDARVANRPTPGLTPVVPEAPTDNPETMIALTVVVDAGEECWIHYRDRDGETGQRLLTGGNRLELELAGPIKLTIGNAGAARIEVGGRAFGSLGMLGQVIHTEVSSDGLAPLVHDEAGVS